MEELRLSLAGKGQAKLFHPPETTRTILTMPVRLGFPCRVNSGPSRATIYVSHMPPPSPLPSWPNLVCWGGVYLA